MNAWSDPRYWKENERGNLELLVTPIDPDYPAEAVVLNGVSYANGEFTGTLQGGGAGPTLAAMAVVSDGLSVTFTVTGSGVGYTNRVYYKTLSATGWTLAGTLSGNGTITKELPKGMYWAMLSSSTAGTTLGFPVAFYVTAEAVSLGYSAAEIMAQRLIEMGMVTDPVLGSDWPVFIGHTPDGNRAPDNLVVVSSTTGVNDGRIARTGEVIEHPGVQIKIRAFTYDEGWNKIQNIASNLNAQGVVDVSLEGGVFRLSNTSQSGSILPMGVEEGTKRRYLFSVNYLLTVKGN